MLYQELPGASTTQQDLDRRDVGAYQRSMVQQRWRAVGVVLAPFFFIKVGGYR